MSSVTIVGANGYAGRDLIRILAAHQKIDEIVPVSRSEAGKSISSVHKSLKNIFDETIINPDFDKICSHDPDLIFFATPSGALINKIPSLLKSGIKVISMSGDCRIGDFETNKRYYNIEGISDDLIFDLLKIRVYGLPELYRSKIKNATFVTNPGCYPTSAILGLTPLKKLKDKLKLCVEKVVVDSMSGSSGAGKNPIPLTHHTNVEGNVIPYNVTLHRHRPEMEFILSEQFGCNVGIGFTPHIMDRANGIISNISVFGADLKSVDLSEHFLKFYEGERFVRVNKNGEDPPNLHNVDGTNFCDIGVYIDDEIGCSGSERVFIISVIDNLIKGGSGQAIQNMNLMLGFDEAEGLL